MNTADQLKRIKELLGAVTGFEDDDQQYVDDARDAVQKLIEALAEQPAQQGPIDQLIHAWQALEETSDRVPDEGNVEGRMHMSVIRSAWKQMDSLVRDLWDERGRP